LCITEDFNIFRGATLPDHTTEHYCCMALPQTRFRTLYVILGSAIGLFILLNYVVLPLYVRHGSTLKVPNVVGLPLEEASRELAARGLHAVEAGSRPDPRTPVGSVVAQNPPADAVVKGGRHVYLAVSGGEPKAYVPELRGRSPRDAKFALERNGLSLGPTNYAPSDLYPENTIMNQSMEPGAEVSRGKSVGIVVSRGRPSGKVPVPGLVGKSTAEAEGLLAEAGLLVGNITYQTSLDLLPNTVVDQFPRAGDSVSVGLPVDLFVVKAGKPKEEIEPLREE
jgi:beta-lactam-binding protein with PASTA domain